MHPDKHQRDILLVPGMGLLSVIVVAVVKPSNERRTCCVEGAKTGRTE
jgi:hypothetical protein